MLDSRSKYLRQLVIRAMKSSRRGHWASSASLIEIIRVLYDDIAKFDSKNPKWENRDRIILSKGHGVLAQAAILADKGIIPMEELDRFCHKDGMLGGHPAPHTPGIECHTGSLGHGFGIGVGMAIAAKIRGQDRRVFVILGDGECNEGSVWEAAMSASKHMLDNLTVIVDYNKLQSAGLVSEIQPLEPLREKWQAFGFTAYECDGHNIEKLKSELSIRYARPFCLIANTTKGKGISYLENNTEKHYLSRLTDEDFNRMEAALDQA